MKLLIIILFALTLVGCDNAPQRPQQAYVPPPPPPDKAIVAKEMPIESRLDMGEMFFGSGATRSITIYYLIAEDGTRCEVDTGTYYRTKVGDKANCNSWK